MPARLNRRSTRMPRISKNEMSAPSMVLRLQTDTLASTAQNQRTSPFLRLPPKIRNIIYRYTVCSRTLTVTSYHVKDKTIFSIYETPDPNEAVGALVSQEISSSELTVFSNICRQIRHEAQMYPYKFTAFRGLSIGLTDFLSAIGEYKTSRIRCVHVDIYYLARACTNSRCPGCMT